MFKFDDNISSATVSALLMQLRAVHMQSTAVLRAAAVYSPDEAKPVIDEVVANISAFDKLIDELEANNKATVEKVKQILEIVQGKIAAKEKANAH